MRVTVTEFLESGDARHVVALNVDDVALGTVRKVVEGALLRAAQVGVSCQVRLDAEEIDAAAVLVQEAQLVPTEVGGLVRAWLRAERVAVAS